MVMEGLAERECAGVVIGTELKDRHRWNLMQRIAHSEAGAYIVQGSADFPFDVFEYPALQQRTIIAVVEWVSDRRWPQLHRVLHDAAAGGRMVAEHLWDLGHRKVLCVNSPMDHGHFEELPPNHSARGHAFVHEWTRRGGLWQAVGHDFADLTADQLGDDFVACFRQPDPPTAVFGVRDYEAWLAQQTIRQRLPELDGHVAIVGYGDTPWSQAGAPPFTTVSYDLAQIAREVMKILDAKRTGKGKCPELVNVPPELIVRRTSVRAGENG
jgi:LacI family transcriptional regulator